MIDIKSTTRRQVFRLCVIILFLLGCRANKSSSYESPTQEKVLRPFYEVAISQKKICDVLRENCVLLKDSLAIVKPWKNDHYNLLLQKADSLVGKIEQTKLILNQSPNVDENLGKYPLSLLPPLHDSLVLFESQLNNSQCKNADTTLYFSNNREDLQQLYLYSPAAVRFTLLTKIQSDVFSVLRECLACELRE